MHTLRTAILMVFLFTSCIFDVGDDNNTMKLLINRPDEKELYGTWILDRFSNEFVARQLSSEFNNTQLLIQDQNNFQMINYPNFDISNKANYLDINGNWKLQKSFNQMYWELELDFPVDSNTNRSLFLKLYSKKFQGLILWQFIGDPDSGNRLLFFKDTIN